MSGQHQQCRGHRRAVDCLAAMADPNLGVELPRRFGRSSRRRPGVQAFPIDDRHVNRRWVRGACRSAAGPRVIFPASTRSRWCMYRGLPASCATATASGSGDVSRTFASLTSIGRLIPANTSTLGRLITEIARLDGVPPNISVRYHNTVAGIDAFDRFDDLEPALLDIIIGTGAVTGLDLRLRPDDVFESGRNSREPSVGNENETDHRSSPRAQMVTPHERSAHMNIQSPSARARRGTAERVLGVMLHCGNNADNAMIH